MPVAVEKMAGTLDFGREVFGKAVTWTGFRLEDGSLFDELISRRADVDPEGYAR